jgi:fucose 4-O-acetylase-like acetyltransferase
MFALLGKGLENIMSNIRELLEPIAAWFRTLGIPEPIVHWGHPAMMAIVVFVMGSFVGLTGWRGRALMAVDKDAAVQSRMDHRKIAPFMFLFIALGYTGGVLSLVMQGEPIFQSPHFWTGSIVIVLLTLNSVIALTGFGKNKSVLRTTHAYVGSVALCLLFLHALLGLKLGMAI